MAITDYLRQILSKNDILAAGKIPGAVIVKKFGFNPLVGAAKTTVWDQGGLYPWTDTAEIFTISSDNAADDIAGVGARTATVFGVDDNYAEYSVSVELTGLTPVEIITNGWRANRIVVDTAGTSGFNVGKIHVGYGIVALGIPANILAIIRPTYNQTQMAVYTVPAGKVAFISDYYNNTGAGKDATIESYARPLGSVFQLKRIVSAFENNFYFPNRFPFYFEEKTDIEIRAISSAAGAPVSVGFDMLIIDKAKFLT